MGRIAIIDMGTNTFHLLIAQVESARYNILHREHEAVKIGMAGINEGLISESARQRAMAAMKKFERISREYHVDEIHACGTSAIRCASNGKALVDEILFETGIAVTVISGDREADLILSGVKAAMNFGDEPNLVMDIGAGSVEFIIGNGTAVFWKKSFEIGGQRLLEKFQHHDPILPAEVDALDAFFRKALQPLLAALREFSPVTLVGSSGTFDTLSDIYSIRSGIPARRDNPEIPLTTEAFYEIHDELLRKDRDARMLIPGMIALRVDMIVVASCLIKFVLDAHPFGNIRVSTYSLKEGVLAEIALSRR